MALADTARLAVQIDLEGNASAGISRLDRQISGLSRSVGRMGRGVGQVGAGFARAGLVVGGAAVAGIAGAAKAAIDFEDAFAGVRKTVDEADLTAAGLSFESLARSFRDMATEIPIAATEFARLGETAGALGVRAQDIDDFVRVTALLGVTTNLTADEAADSLGRIGTILDFTGKDFETFADSLVALGNAGASTESEIIEITKRFAAEGESAGLASEQIAALASATASLGFAPERGGTALARVFANMATNIATANAKGKALSRAIGKPIRELQRDIDRGEGLPIFLDVLREIRDMSPTQAARFLKDIGVTNVSDRTIFRTMADQLPFVNEQLEIAQTATGALSVEATKRFDTVASKITKLKNNITEAAITVGEGLIPALGNAAEKLSAFLKSPENRTELRNLGRDIGAAIDKIDWDAVLAGARDFVGVMKSALDFSLRILEALNKLPDSVKAAGLGFLALNKLSGGLVGAGVGNIAGGLAGAAAQGLASRAPGVGKLFAQPVFVTNWPPGMGLGGGAVPAGRGGGIGGVVRNVAGVTIAGAIVAAAVPIGQAFANALPPSLKGPGGRGITDSQRAAEFHRSLQPVQQAVIRNGFVVTDQVRALAMQEQRRGERLVQSQAQIKASIEASKERLAAAQAETERETSRGVTATRAVRNAEVAGASRIVGAQSSAASRIVDAIYNARPVVNVTNVTRSTTVHNRYGPQGGSSSQERRGGH